MEGTKGREGRPDTAWGGGADDFVTEFSKHMLTSLPRRDQRERGESYVSGLLSTPGRKSMRSIASVVGGGAAEQRLHHFISKSSWDWLPVRRALAGHLERTLLPHAWVIRPMFVVKTGEHTVGVEESFVPQLGRVVNSQKSYSVWMANEEQSAPVNWRMILPSDWLRDTERRRRAEIPDGEDEADPGTVALHTALEPLRTWGLRCRPLVMDVRDHDAGELVRNFFRQGIPFVLRIDGTTPLLPNETLSTGHGDQLLQAQQLVKWVKKASRQVGLTGPQRPVNRPALVTGTKVTLPASGGGLPLQLAGAWTGGRRQPDELWLTNLTDAPPVLLLRLGRLTERVDNDFAEISTRVGVRDFEGRTFGGWHRHVTLSSVAHAIVTLSASRHQGERGERSMSRSA
ncbi:transposase [Streptomyces sp. N2-109]|uniref:Transposase n=1 Tax=Streptomyces gossypii TaxID=2883101 RepID=A0ABT2K0I8_9ACTN|nr:transposase [Streptomyces gossypii]MCT2593149.1 transposase [Streptomyces gossypii]